MITEAGVNGDVDVVGMDADVRRNLRVEGTDILVPLDRVTYHSQGLKHSTHFGRLGVAQHR